MTTRQNGGKQAELALKVMGRAFSNAEIQDSPEKNAMQTLLP